MKRYSQIYATMDRRWIFPLAIGAIFSLILLFLATLITPDGANADGSPYRSVVFPFGFGYRDGRPLFVETKLTLPSPSALPPPPRLAYLISGSVGDGERLKRTLQSVYHPLNRYIVHLDLDSPPRERISLYNYIRSDPVFKRFKNVYVITKSNLITYRGPTMVANTLHAAAILLRKGGDWDWFINLSASDYPLVTQDDLLHTFSYLPRDLNFIEHTSNVGWKEFQRAKPIIIDPGLYLSKKSEVFWVSQRRSVPTSFRLFTVGLSGTMTQEKSAALASDFVKHWSDEILASGTLYCPYSVKQDWWACCSGSAWMGLSRAFIEYCIWGWDNLPRTVLMYYANFISSPEGYFHTVICNTHEFLNTTVNHDLHYIEWDHPPKQHPHYLMLNHTESMINSSAPFARKFYKDDPVLDKIDAELLGRGRGQLAPGGWCIGDRYNGSDPCSLIGDPTVLRPGPGSWRLEQLMVDLLSKEKFRPTQCA